MIKWPRSPRPTCSGAMNVDNVTYIVEPKIDSTRNQLNPNHNQLA